MDQDGTLKEQEYIECDNSKLKELMTKNKETAKVLETMDHIEVFQEYIAFTNTVSGCFMYAPYAEDDRQPVPESPSGYYCSVDDWHQGPSLKQAA